MKDCGKGLQISAYLDGELPPDVGAELGRHLDGCPGCRALYDAMASERSLLANALPDLDPPERVKRQLLSRMEPSGPAWSGIFRFRGWAVAFASTFLLAVTISAVHYERRAENNRILSEIDRSRVEWMSRDLSVNPFDDRIPDMRHATNPFQSYLGGR